MNAVFTFHLSMPMLLLTQHIAMQQYDSVSKFVMFEYTEAIAKLIFGNVKIVVLGRLRY